MANWMILTGKKNPTRVSANEGNLSDSFFLNFVLFCYLHTLASRSMKRDLWRDGPPVFWRTEMIEIVDGFPEGVIAIAARQHVIASDYDNALIPLVEEALETRRKIRLYYEMDNEFFGLDVGSAFKYLKSWARYLLRWERIAVVSSSVWVWMGMSVFRLLMPGRFKLFTTRRAAEARGWITAPNPV